MSSRRLLAVPRSSTAVLKRFFANRGRSPVSIPPGRAPPEPPPNMFPEAHAKQATGAIFSEHERPVGDGSKRPESQYPVTETGGRTEAGRQEQDCVWKSATGQRGIAVSKSPFVFAILPSGQNRAAGESERSPVPGRTAATERSTVGSAETEESTVVYHPGDEEYVNWGRIKPPGEPPDDEEQREAVHEMLKWKRVTEAVGVIVLVKACYDLTHIEKQLSQAALVIISVKALYDLTHIEEEIHRPFLDAPRPRYPYMRIRHKDFPWGPCDLLDLDCWRERKMQNQQEVEALHNRRLRG
ncbi:hypothetical protein KFL_002050050 [Klebsormidium nitens]|uniref:Uncharacterized protein n=1 Tax=Klebsormidium nitens TaxID=105231 RepID=A0A1Y1I2R8_KLENI|nr:hypothetical protein KFL_002050050 [Klebsormidium nitens]|eukprot:GAQ84763.1 hypothetical protein KFL_002050050 [Klebsormidium nitens]